MRTLLLDASVILAAYDADDTHHDAARELMLSPEFILTTLDLARYEVANVVVRAWRVPSRAGRLLDAVERIGRDGGVMRSTAELIRAATGIADEHGISVYDAAYVAASRDRVCPLVSCDSWDLLFKQLAIAPTDVAARRPEPHPSPAERDPARHPRAGAGGAQGGGTDHAQAALRKRRGG